MMQEFVTKTRYSTEKCILLVECKVHTILVILYYFIIDLYSVNVLQFLTFSCAYTATVHISLNRTRYMNE